MNSNRNYNRHDRPRDRNSRFGGGDRFGGNRGYDRPQMHQAVCSSCGKNCEVPFMPSNGKPVYCSDCFRKSNGRYQEGDGDYTRNSRPSPQHSGSGVNKEELDKQFERLNLKLNEIERLLTSLTMKGASPIKKKIPINSKVKKAKKKI